ncbi:GNAT family N-acetyltransferase [Nocardioides sp. KIGAM211]|uniref:GNAT family N-acetyltransferase n=1 Tax=Nocardioides luti TaxID=2761101 RepID=A0A7X0RGH4_9ACTN|nr:GNAT family N-acetyltransferase [Nocardioides luti]MBB6627846.1 GNAT family N-acetyltransferase [Nocardioides luti]
MQPVGPSPSLNLRLATERDIAFLTDLVVVVTRAQGRVPDDFDEAEYRNGFAGSTIEQVAGRVEDSTTYVVEIDGERAGRLRVVRFRDRHEIAGIQLLPAHQGRGLGTHLIEQLISEARDAGLPVRLGVEHDNPRARSLYERLGFVKVGSTDQEALMEWRDVG